MDDETTMVVNLDTGDVMGVDPYMLMGVGPPDGYRLLSEVTKLELAAAIRRAAREPSRGFVR